MNADSRSETPAAATSKRRAEAPRPFIFVWQRAIRDAELTASVKGFAVLLSTWANADGTSCFPSIATLGELGYAKRTVHRHLRALEVAGWLDVRHGGGRRADASYTRNEYTLTLPSGVPNDTVTEGSGVSDDTVSERSGGALVSVNGVPSVSERCHERPSTNPSTSSGTEEEEVDVEVDVVSVADFLAATPDTDAETIAAETRAYERRVRRRLAASEKRAR